MYGDNYNHDEGDFVQLDFRQLLVEFFGPSPEGASSAAPMLPPPYPCLAS